MVIRRLGLHKYGLYSIASGRRLGVFRSKKAAIARERQIEYFKHQDARRHYL